MNPLKYLSGKRRPEEPPEEETPSSGLLLELNKRATLGQVKVYAGSVPAHVIKHRRDRNKMARKSRRANRG